jgi:hypothetical protein
MPFFDFFSKLLLDIRPKILYNEKKEIEMTKSIILIAIFSSFLSVFAFSWGESEESRNVQQPQRIRMQGGQPEQWELDEANSEASRNIATEDLPQIIIRNNTGYEIVHYKLRYRLFDEWQFSGDVVLRNGNAMIINLPYPLEVQSKDPNMQNPPADYYDIQLIDIDGNTYFKFLVLISTNAQVIDFTFSDIGAEDAYIRPPALPGYN